MFRDLAEIVAHRGYQLDGSVEFYFQQILMFEDIIPVRFGVLGAEFKVGQ